MANKRLKVGGENLKLAVKKDKTQKKSKWQAKIGGKKGKISERVGTPEAIVESQMI